MDNPVLSQVRIGAVAAAAPRRRPLLEGPRIALGLVIAGALIAPAPSRAATLKIRQVDGAADTARAYVSVLDSIGVPIDGVRADDLEPTMGGRCVRIAAAASMARADEGIGYLFVVAVTDAAVLERVRSALERWLAVLRDQDRATILPPEGVPALAADGVRRAVATARRIDADLPAHRVIVVFADDLAAGPHLSPPGDDVTGAPAPWPIFVVHATSGRGADAPRQDALRSLALTSGGDYEDTGLRRIAATTAAVRERIRQVLRVDLSATDCESAQGPQGLRLTWVPRAALPSDQAEWPGVAAGAAVAATPRASRSSAAAFAWSLGVLVGASAAVTAWLARRRRPARAPAPERTELENTASPRGSHPCWPGELRIHPDGGEK